MGEAMPRDRLVELLKLMASAVPDVEEQKVNYYCFVADSIILDYCGDDALAKSYREYVSKRDFERATQAMYEVFDLIFDAEIFDCYFDFCFAVLERQPEYVN